MKQQNHAQKVIENFKICLTNRQCQITIEHAGGNLGVVCTQNLSSIIYTMISIRLATRVPQTIQHTQTHKNKSCLMWKVEILIWVQHNHIRKVKQYDKQHLFHARNIVKQINILMNANLYHCKHENL